jgi:hypothetical protein
MKAITTLRDMDTLKIAAMRLNWLCNELRQGNSFSSETLAKFETEARQALAAFTPSA